MRWIGRLCRCLRPHAESGTSEKQQESSHPGTPSEEHQSASRAGAEDPRVTTYAAGVTALEYQILFFRYQP